LYVAKLNNFNPCENTHNDNHQNRVTSYTSVRRRERRGSNGTEKIIFSDHCASSGQMVITTALQLSLVAGDS